MFMYNIVNCPSNKPMFRLGNNVVIAVLCVAFLYSVGITIKHRTHVILGLSSPALKNSGGCLLMGGTDEGCQTGSLHSVRH